MIRPGLRVKIKSTDCDRGYIVSVLQPDSEKPLCYIRLDDHSYININIDLIEELYDENGQLVLFW